MYGIITRDNVVQIIKHRNRADRIRWTLQEKLRGRRISRASIAKESMGKKPRRNASEKGLVTIIGLALIYFSESTKRHSRLGSTPNKFQFV